MIIEKQIHIIDPEYPIDENTTQIQTLEALIIGQGNLANAPKILTIELEKRSWRAVRNPQMKLFTPYDERTLLYEFNSLTGQLERACLYKGSKFKDRLFRFYERLIEEWVPINPKVPKRNKDIYNNIVDKAYECALGMKTELSHAKNQDSCTTKEKDNIDYLIRGLEVICKYDKKNIKIK